MKKHDQDKLNRVRHTVLTNGARDGLTALQLASITDVTMKAVEKYIDLNHAAKLDISEHK